MNDNWHVACPERLHDIVALIERAKINLSVEADAQAGLLNRLTSAGYVAVREYQLSAGSRIDLFVEGGIGIEVKVRGSAAAIMRQVDRYAMHDDIRAIVLATTKVIALPSTIRSKPAAVANLGRGWL